MASLHPYCSLHSLSQKAKDEARSQKLIEELVVLFNFRKESGSGYRSEPKSKYRKNGSLQVNYEMQSKDVVTKEQGQVHIKCDIQGSDRQQRYHKEREGIIDRPIASYRRHRTVHTLNSDTADAEKHETDFQVKDLSNINVIINLELDMS